MRTLDTNVFIRAITDDDPHMSEAAGALFTRLGFGADRALVLEAVVAEVVYVLLSGNLYGFTREDVRDRLGYFLSLPGILLENGSRIPRALDLFVQHRQLGFIDALIAVTAMEQTPPELYSFDRGFDRVNGVIRVEPSL